jgi:hypothetical protein
VKAGGEKALGERAGVVNAELDFGFQAHIYSV